MDRLAHHAGVRRFERRGRHRFVQGTMETEGYGRAAFHWIIKAGSRPFETEPWVCHADSWRFETDSRVFEADSWPFETDPFPGF